MKLLAATCALLAGLSIAARCRADTDEAGFAVILDSLEQGRGPAALWWNGWAVGFSACTVVQGTIALAAHDRGLRIDSAVGAAGCALGVAGVLLQPRTAITASSELRALDASTPAARRLRLRRAEALLDQIAQEEIEGRSWVPHVAGASVNLAGSAVLWIGYGRYLSGWLNLLGGTLVTELQIATRPTAAIALSERHRPQRVSLWLVPTPGGAAVGGAF